MPELSPARTEQTTDAPGSDEHFEASHEDGEAIIEHEPSPLDEPVKPELQLRDGEYFYKIKDIDTEEFVWVPAREGLQDELLAAYLQMLEQEASEFEVPQPEQDSDGKQAFLKIQFVVDETGHGEMISTMEFRKIVIEPLDEGGTDQDEEAALDEGDFDEDLGAWDFDAAIPDANITTPPANMPVGSYATAPPVPLTTATYEAARHDSTSQASEATAPGGELPTEVPLPLNTLSEIPGPLPQDREIALANPIFETKPQLSVQHQGLEAGVSITLRTADKPPLTPIEATGSKQYLYESPTARDLEIPVSQAPDAAAPTGVTNHLNSPALPSENRPTSKVQTTKPESGRPDADEVSRVKLGETKPTPEPVITRKVTEQPPAPDTPHEPIGGTELNLQHPEPTPSLVASEMPGVISSTEVSIATPDVSIVLVPRLEQVQTAQATKVGKLQSAETGSIVRLQEAKGDQVVAPPITTESLQPQPAVADMIAPPNVAETPIAQASSTNEAASAPAEVAELDNSILQTIPSPEVAVTSSYVGERTIQTAEEVTALREPQSLTKPLAVSSAQSPARRAVLTSPETTDAAIGLEQANAVLGSAEEQLTGLGRPAAITEDATEDDLEFIVSAQSAPRRPVRRARNRQVNHV
jgi:hypothetical protein